MGTHPSEILSTRARAAFAEALGQRVGELRSVWGDGANAQANGALVARVDRDLHNLAGAGALFGFSLLGDIAIEVQELLHIVPAEVSAGLARIEAAIDTPDPLVDACDMNGMPDVGEVLVVEGDPIRAEETASQIGHFGYPVGAFLTLDALLEHVGAGAKPVAVVLSSAAGLAAQVADLSRLCGAMSVPVLVVTEHGEVDARLALRRAGASAILAHPAEATSLVEGIDELTRARQPEPYRVLILEDDLLLGDHMARTLQAAGMLAQVVADPLRMAGPIEQFKPDLVLIDALLDGCSGTELAWVIRQDDRHLGMGILFLATPPVARRLAGDLRRQGEDHLLLPVTDVELVESIRVRARRARRMCSRMEMDGRTGLLAPVRFQDRMDHEVSRCVRHGLIVAMGLVDLDNSQELDERFGPGAREQVIGRLARLLRQRLRRTDIIGRVGPDEVGVLMPHTTAGQAHKVLENVRLLFAATPFVSDRGEEFHVTISAGISTCPVHVQPSQLNRAATRALDAAKDRGRNLVLSETDVSP